MTPRQYGMSGNAPVVNMPPAGFCTIQLGINLTFTVLERYQGLQVTEFGGNGVICRAQDTSTGTTVAIKKLFGHFRNEASAKRAYRELMTMKLANHTNIIKLLDAFTPETSSSNFQDIYLVMDWMDINFEQLMNGNMNTRAILDQHRISLLLYQMLCGLKHLHSAGIIHRDLKPASMAINRNFNLKIMNLGSARILESTYLMTESVTTRYYRAPEIILGMGYDEKCDIWSLGCIFGEILSRNIVFPGLDYFDQWKRIEEKLGTPNLEFIEKTPDYVRFLFDGRERKPGFSFEQLFPDVLFADDLEDWELKATQARDLLSKMLTVDPEHRINVDEALRHPYMIDFYDDAERNAPAAAPYDHSVEEQGRTMEQWKELIFSEVNAIRNQDTPMEFGVER